MEEVPGPQVQIAFSILLPHRQHGGSLGRAPAPIVCQSTPKLILPGSEHGCSPRRIQFLSVIIESHPHVAKWGKWLKQQTAFHEGRVAETADDFEAERLFPLADTYVPQQWHLSLLNPDIRKCWSPKESKIHLKEVVGCLGDTSFGRQSSAAKVSAILNIAIFLTTGEVLLNPAHVGLKDSVDRYRRQRFFG